MLNPEAFCAGLTPSPIASIGTATYTSTPTTSMHRSGNESQQSLQTPVKCIGHLYNSQQYKTPNGRSQGWSGLVQSSPCLKTPGSGASGQGIRSTARLKTPGSHSSKKGTPLRHATPKQPYNPFEQNLLDRLDGSVFSPNVFAEVRSETQTPKSFRWTVDELAILKPVEIDEMQQQPEAIGAQADNDMEKRAQEAIDNYFANNLIAPSPWSESGKSKPFILPCTPKTPASPSQINSPMTFGDRKTLSAEKKKSPVRDSGCQTTLTLPVDFDMEKVLGDYMTYNKHRDSEDPQELMSMSSLRRKLFFHGEEGVPPSPVQPSKTGGGDNMDFDVSPIKNIHRTPKQLRRSPMETPTPGSSQFSSSPISSSRSGNALTPFLRRCSTDPDLMESPGFSPISSKNNMHSHASHMMTPLCQPLQATPSSERVMRPFDSPGMSPIVQHDGSFVITPLSQLGVPKRRGRPDKVPVPAELLGSSDIDDEEDISFQHMEVGEELPKISEEELSFLSSQDDQFTKARQRDADCTQYSDDELSTQDACQTYFVSHASHDTGYNTNSLQLTNYLDPSLQSSLHTNLTQQFGSLPMSSQDIVDMDSSGLEIGKKISKKPIVRHLASKLRSRAQDNESGEIVLNEREVRRRAKQVLGKSISMDDSQLGASLDSSTLRPKLLNFIGVSSMREKPGIHSDDDDQEHGSSHKVLPSELASHVLQKAGEDFRRYCHSPDFVTNSHQTQTQHSDDQYYLVNMDAETAPGIRVSMSAEF